jgi:hypothetical protein
MKMLTGKYELNQTLDAEQQKILDGVREQEAKRPEPTVVAEQVHHFLTSDTPRLRYMAAPDKATADRVMRGTLARTLQLNASQPAYTLSRDQLVALLDEGLAAQAAGK